MIDIFENKNINNVLNQIYSFLETAKDVDAPEQVVPVTGRVAALLQEKESPTPEQIVLITADEDIYSWVHSDFISLLNPKGFVAFKNRCLFYFEDFFLEIWKSETALSVVEANKVYCQTYSTIPSELL